MTLISIRENTGETDNANATVRFDHGSEYPISISSPFAEEDELHLSWYFEHYPYQTLPDHARAQEVVERITHYGELLFQQVFAEPDVLNQYHASIAAGLEHVRLEIIGSPAFHRLHWETLKDPVHPQPLAQTARMVRNVPSYHSLHITLFPAPSINVLVVSARPGEDTAPARERTIGRTLIEAVQGLPVHVDILTPGSYEALAQHLETSFEQHGIGYYHIIQFDIGGAYLSYAELQADQEHYRLQNRYGRSDLEAYEGKRPFLFMEDVQEGGIDLVEPTELVDILINHQISLVFLAAYRSQVVGNLACTLRAQGSPLVLALDYPMNVRSVKLFMRTLYEHMIAGDYLSTAVTKARSQLAMRKERLGFFNQAIALEDWLVPVVYQNQERFIEIRERTPDEQLDQEQDERTIYEFPAPAYAFVGRDRDILHIEKYLSQQNILLVHGIGGAGKTTLLNYLGAWWQQIGLVDQVFSFGYDQQAWTLDYIIDTIARNLLSKADYYNRVFCDLNPEMRRSMIIRRLRTQRHLLILDNLSSITGAHLAVQNTLPAREKSSLRQFLTELVPGKTLIVLGSRNFEHWLTSTSSLNNGFAHLQVYELLGLDNEAASWLASHILHYHAIGEREPADLLYQNLEHLLHLVQGYPLALEVLMPRLKHMSSTELLKTLQQTLPAQPTEMTEEQPSSEEMTSQIVLHSVEYTCSNLSPEMSGMIACLVPFTSVINQELFDTYTHYLQQQPAIAHLPFSRWREVIHDLTAKGLLSTYPEIAGVLQLHPVFFYFLRDYGQQDDVRQAIETAFCQLYDHVGKEIVERITSQDDAAKQQGQEMATLEYKNLFNALMRSLRSHAAFFHIYRALFLHLDLNQDYHGGLDLSEMVREQIMGYPHEQRQGALGIELASVLDDIAMRQFLLSYYDQARETYQQELDIIASLENVDASLQSKLTASAYYHLGQIAQSESQWAQAESLYLQALKIFIESDNRYEQASTYHQLGIVAQEQQQWSQAESCHQQALKIFLDFGDRQSQAWSFHQLGIVKQSQRQWARAEIFYQQELKILVELNDRYEQARTFYQMGMVSQEQRQWQQAEHYYQQSLEIFLEFQDRRNEAKIYHQLGILAQTRRQWEQAEEYYRQALRIFIELNSRYDQAGTYSQLGTLAQARRQWNLAKDYYQQVLQIFLAFNDKYNQAKTYRQLGQVAQSQRHWMQAESYYQQALKIFSAINDRCEQANTLVQLGMLARSQRDWDEARRFYEEALALFAEMDERYDQASTYHKLCIVTQAQCLWQEAEDYARKALHLYIDLNNLHLQANMYGQLGILARAQKAWQQAREHFLHALQIYVGNGDNHSAGIILGDLAWLWRESGDTELPAAIASVLNVSVAEIEERLQRKNR
jgi:tetratricopeptide (TPR) repeat protein